MHTCIFNVIRNISFNHILIQGFTQATQFLFVYVGSDAFAQRVSATSERFMRPEKKKLRSVLLFSLLLVPRTQIELFCVILITKKYYIKNLHPSNRLSIIILCTKKWFTRCSAKLKSFYFFFIFLICPKLFAKNLISYCQTQVAPSKRAKCPRSKSVASVGMLLQNSW